jgi:hypothetical protein
VTIIEQHERPHEQAGTAEGQPPNTVPRDARELYDAAARGDIEWFRARAAQAPLENPIEDFGGCLTVAARHNRIDVVRLLLDLGFDPNERTRFRSVGGDGVVFNWGMPLWQCAAAGRYEIAELLLERGADPNADVYASGTPVMQAHSRGDRRMVALLEQYGGVVDAATAGAYGLVDRARVLLAGPQEDPPRASVAAQLLLEGAGGGHEEIVRLALDRIDWLRDEARWFGVLEQPPRRATGVESFRLELARCDPNIRGRGPFVLMILHRVAGSPDRVPAEMTVAFATMLLDAGARLDVRDTVADSFNEWPPPASASLSEHNPLPRRTDRYSRSGSCTAQVLNPRAPAVSSQTNSWRVVSDCSAPACREPEPAPRPPCVTSRRMATEEAGGRQRWAARSCACHRSELLSVRCWPFGRSSFCSPPWSRPAGRPRVPCRMASSPTRKPTVVRHSIHSDAPAATALI